MVTLLSMVTTMATRHYNQSASRILMVVTIEIQLTIIGKFYAMGPLTLSIHVGFSVYDFCNVQGVNQISYYKFMLASKQLVGLDGEVGNRLIV